MVKRFEYLEIPVRVEYTLTEKAVRLQPILLELSSGRLREKPKQAAARKPPCDEATSAVKDRIARTGIELQYFRKLLGADVHPLNGPGGRVVLRHFPKTNLAALNYKPTGFDKKKALTAWNGLAWCWMSPGTWTPPAGQQNFC